MPRREHSMQSIINKTIAPDFIRCGSCTPIAFGNGTKRGMYLVTPFEWKSVPGLCKGVTHMLGWISENSVLRLITVFLVFSAALNRSKRSNIQLIINASVIAVALPLYSVTEGFYGIVTGLSGAATATLLALPLYRFGWMGRMDIFTTCVIGILVGPAGFALSYGIATGFVVAQHALKARTTNMTEHLFSSSPFYPPARYHGTSRPLLIEMESHRMLDDDSREGITFGEFAPSHRWGATISIAPACNEVLPWPGKIALATIAVLMLGIHW